MIFSDFECPYCKKAAAILRAEPLIKEGKQVRVIYRNYPLPQHPSAQKAAEAATCAGFQSSDYFWQYHDLLFEEQGKLNVQNADAEMKTLAARMPGLEITQFSDCLGRQLSLGTVLRDKSLGENLGVNATPTIFINGQPESIVY